MAERRKKKFSWHEFRVGLFVIGSFAILLFMIFRVSGGRGLFAPRDTAVSYLPTIEGLKPGAPVWLNGIEVGNVEEITLEEELPQTRANIETQQKIATFREDIQRYQRLIQESQDRVLQQEERLAVATGRDKETVNLALQDEQERLSSLRRSLEQIEQDLKISQNNLQNIRLLLKIEENFTEWIKRDSEVSIGSIGLLGDKYVEISIGRSGQKPLKTEEGHIFIEGVNEATIRQLMVGANDLIANFGEISESVRSITTKLDAGDGTIGQLINNTVLHDSLTATVQSLDKAVNQAELLFTDLHQSEGTLGQIIHDKELYVEITDTVRELKQFISQLNQSEGTMHKLIHEAELYDNLEQITTKIDHIVERIDKGEGTLGKLTVDDAVFVETRQSLEKIRSILEQIDQGQGTLGMLLKDKQLYENLSQSLAELAKLVYDIRKNPKKYLKVKFSIF